MDPDPAGDQDAKHQEQLTTTDGQDEDPTPETEAGVTSPCGNLEHLWPKEIRTKRLVIRPYRKSDSPDIARLLNDYEVSKMCSRIPFPYTLHDAEFFLENLCRSPTGVTYAITLATEKATSTTSGSGSASDADWDGDGILIGSIGIFDVFHLDDPAKATGMIGYWLGRPFWGKGFATEAGNAIVQVSFLKMGLSIIHGEHWCENPASGRVMQKIGFVYDPKEAKELAEGGTPKTRTCAARGGVEVPYRTLFATRQQFLSTQKQKILDRDGTGGGDHSSAESEPQKSHKSSSADATKDLRQTVPPPDQGTGTDTE